VAYKKRYSKGETEMLSHYTTDALKHQLINAMDWYDKYAYSPKFNYSDDERKEMLDEIEEINEELARR
jgi:ABC-type thiamine transport system substrate-binding protein